MTSCLAPGPKVQRRRQGCGYQKRIAKMLRVPAALCTDDVGGLYVLAVPAATIVESAPHTPLSYATHQYVLDIFSVIVRPVTTQRQVDRSRTIVQCQVFICHGYRPIRPDPLRTRFYSVRF